MIYSEQGFKKYEELSEEEKEMCYLLAKFSMVEAFNGGILKGEFIKKNVGNLKTETNMTQEELQRVINTLFSTSMKMAFGKERAKVGFSRDDNADKE